MKRIVLFSFVFSTLLLIGCGKANTVEESYTQISTIVQETIEMSTEDKEEATIQLYYGNTSANGLLTKEINIKGLTPENLLFELAKKNIVSVDTKVRSFQVVEKGDEVIVDLNLSKEFKEYVGMMGTAGEYIVLASLTNTFLEAYKGTSLILNVNGMPLETGHSIYDQPLEKYPLNNEEIEVRYELEETKIEDEIYHISYPQLRGMEDEAFMNKWNRIIEEIVKEDFGQKELVSHKVEYEIATKEADVLSLVFRGESIHENAAYPYRYAKTLNIDIKGDREKRLADYTDINQIAKVLQEGQGYEILSDIAKEEVATYLQGEYLEDLSILLFDYDYLLSNKGLIPTGYSYIKENKPVLVINVIHAMGDYVEIKMNDFVEK